MEKRSKVQMDDKRYKITYQDKSEDVQILTSSQVDTMKITPFVESVVEIE